MTTDLTKYDFILLLDKSGSMGTPDAPGGKTRWQYAQEGTEAVARKAAEFDQDGITVIPFANTFKVYDGVTPDKVTQVFTEGEPNGGTDTAAALQHVFNGYFEKKAAGEAKPIVVLVVTDGAPNDKEAVKNAIISASNKLDADEEIGITFLQVGNDAGATAFLKELDDQLQSAGAKFDIVDTKTFDEVESIGLTEALLQSLSD